MTTLINRYKSITKILISLITGMILFTACSNTETESASDAGDSNDIREGVVQVTAIHNVQDNAHLYEMSSNQIPAGWTTFEFINSSAYDHFLLIWKVPEEGIEAIGAGNSVVEYWEDNITIPFQEAFNPYIRGDIEFSEFTDNLVGTVSGNAPWFFDPGAQAMGGPGLTAAGTISETTVNLEPGEYVAECYVKNGEEVFHSAIGMLEHFTVTEDSSMSEEPEPETRLTISSEEGFQGDIELTAGEHIIEVFFIDQMTYENLAGHNVQLVQLADKEDEELLSDLSEWMDWRKPGGLVNRAPEGAEFMGGSMEMAEGSTAYFHINLEPGDYAWIAEIPNPADHNMLKTFTVSEE